MTKTLFHFNCVKRMPLNGHLHGKSKAINGRSETVLRQWLLRTRFKFHVNDFTSLHKYNAALFHRLTVTAVSQINIGGTSWMNIVRQRGIRHSWDGLSTLTSPWRHAVVVVIIANEVQMSRYFWKTICSIKLEIYIEARYVMLYMNHKCNCNLIVQSWI